MTSEIRLRSHPPRTPSSANNPNPSNNSGYNSASEVSASSVPRRGSGRRLPGEEYWTTWNLSSRNYHEGAAPSTTSTDGAALDSYTSPVRRHVSSGSSSYAPLHIQYQQDMSMERPNMDHHHNNTTPPYDNMGKIRTGKLLRAEKTRLEDYHVAYRTPLHVPDNEYRAYLQGRTGKSRRDIPMVTRTCCLQTCVGFSVVAILFLCFVGFLINSQPILMAGTLPKKLVQDSDGRSATRYILPAPGEVPPMARTAYRAAMAYFLCIVGCLVALNPGWVQSQIHRRRGEYQDIPDQPIPMHNAETPNWTQTVWNRCSYIIRQRLTDRGWYHPGPKIKKDRKTG